MSERKQQPLPTNSAVRISEAMKWAAPENTFWRWVGPHIRTLGPTITHDKSSSEITADYRKRNLLPRWKRVETAGYGLKIRGNKKIYNNPSDIETFFQTHAPEGENVESLEGQFLHGIISHGETHRNLPEKNRKHVEQLILKAYFGNAQTVAEQDGRTSIYTPFVPSLTRRENPRVESDHTKMVRIITDKPSLTDKEVFDTRQILQNNRVIAALNAIPYHAVTIKTINEDTVQITAPKGEPVTVNLSIREQREEAPERQYGAEEADRYHRSRHGPDGEKFLDPYLNNFLEHAQGEKVLDVGTGAATVAIEAVQKHDVLHVHGVDKFPAMLERGRQAVDDAQLSDRISLEEADAASLTQHDSSFSKIISVNVGCNLDADTLSNHLNEMARVLTDNGEILLTAPIKLGEVFTNGDHEALWRNLYTALTKIETDGTMSQEIIQGALGDIKELHRGTFVVRNGKIKLVVANDGLSKIEIPQEFQSFIIAESALQEGEPIWRKLPGLVVPNNYHSQADYETKMEAAGLEIVTREIGNFITEDERERYNSEIPTDQPERKLGPEYVGQGPFAVYTLSKKT